MLVDMLLLGRFRVRFGLPRHLTLSQQFAIASFPILLLALAAIGFWVEREIERGVATRISEVQSLYLDSLIAAHLPDAIARDALDDKRQADLDALLDDTALGRRVVAFILWRRDGSILYSNDKTLIGRAYEVGEGLRSALDGRVYSRVVDGEARKHGVGSLDWPDRMIETYTPIHAAGSGDVVGAAEFYMTTDELDTLMAGARMRSWGVVTAILLGMYALLYGLIARGSRTITDQRHELRERVRDLTALAATNARLASQARVAGARTTALNEAFLRRIATDLHDGPAQDIGFAQMNVRALLQAGEGGVVAAAPTPQDAATLDRLGVVGSALDLAMADLRAICAGMQLPELETMSLAEVAARAVRDYERKTARKVRLVLEGDAGSVALPIKITTFRILQEALANGYRHAGGQDQLVHLEQTADAVFIEVRDSGPGFDASAADRRGSGGIAGMCERAQALGGRFELESSPLGATSVRVQLPLRIAESPDE